MTHCPEAVPYRPISGHDSRGLVLEQQRSESGQVAAPDHPGVGAGRLDLGVPDILRAQPVAELTVGVDESVVTPASDPKQAQLRIGLGVERREGGIEVIAEPAGAEGANPREAVQGVKAGL